MYPETRRARKRSCQTLRRRESIRCEGTSVRFQDGDGSGAVIISARSREEWVGVVYTIAMSAQNSDRVRLRRVTRGDTDYLTLNIHKFTYPFRG